MSADSPELYVRLRWLPCLFVRGNITVLVSVFKEINNYRNLH